MIGPTRFWFDTVLPTVPPTAYNKLQDIFTLPDGSTYQWVNSKWTPYVLPFKGIKGDTGAAATVKVGTTTTLSAGSPATAGMLATACRNASNCKNASDSKETSNTWTPMTMTEVFRYRTGDSESTIFFSVTGLKIPLT